jgi:hypothetical protein
MRGDSRDKQPVFPTGMEKHSGPLGMVTIPLLHSLSGNAGAADEVLIALVGGLVLVLVLSFVLFGIKAQGKTKMSSQTTRDSSHIGLDCCLLPQ